jgi:hypothetical protein
VATDCRSVSSRVSCQHRFGPTLPGHRLSDPCRQRTSVPIASVRAGALDLAAPLPQVPVCLSKLKVEGWACLRRHRRDVRQGGSGGSRTEPRTGAGCHAPNGGGAAVPTAAARNICTRTGRFRHGHAPGEGAHGFGWHQINALRSYNSTIGFRLIGAYIAGMQPGCIGRIVQREMQYESFQQLHRPLSPGRR